MNGKSSMISNPAFVLSPVEGLPRSFSTTCLKLDSRSLSAREPLHSYITTVKKKKFPAQR
jgi:hypothetical protein